jgi:hypothetical protein
MTLGFGRAGGGRLEALEAHPLPGGMPMATILYVGTGGSGVAVADTVVSC